MTENQFGWFLVFSTIGFLVVVTFLLCVASSYSCGLKAEAMGLRHTWGFFTNCMVEYNGKYVPIENVRYLGQ